MADSNSSTLKRSEPSTTSDSSGPPTKKPTMPFHKKYGGGGGSSNAKKAAGTVEPKSRGIFVTCDRGREQKCIMELQNVISRILPEDDKAAGDADEKEEDIEAAIGKELEEMNNTKEQKVWGIKLDCECSVFFRLHPSLDPVELAREITARASQQPPAFHTRYIQRLTPVSLTGRASLEGLQATARTVLAPHFGPSQTSGISYMIHSSRRMHGVLKRDDIIMGIAAIVNELGEGLHGVDLKAAHKVVVVEVYKNVCGVSVLDGMEWRSRNRFNVQMCLDAEKVREDSLRKEVKWEERMERKEKEKVEEETKRRLMEEPVEVHKKRDEGADAKEAGGKETDVKEEAEAADVKAATEVQVKEPDKDGTAAEEKPVQAET